MADELRPVERAVEKSIDNARGGIDNYFDVVQKIMGVNPWSGTNLIDKAQRFSIQNVHATFEFLIKLGKAKDFGDAFRIQTEFLQGQMISLADQFKALGEAYSKAIADSGALRKSR